MPVFFSNTSLGVDLRVLTFQLDDIPVTLHYFVRQNGSDQAHPADLSIWFLLREVDHKILRPQALKQPTTQQSDQDALGVEHKTRGVINELCKDEHIWSTQAELRLLKALGLFPLRTPRVVLIPPATVVKLLRHFRNDFKALMFESIIIRIRIEAWALKCFLVTMKRTIYEYNQDHNLSHANQVSYDLLKSTTGVFTPYPPAWAPNFGDNAPLMDTLISIMFYGHFARKFTPTLVPQYSSIHQLPPLPSLQSAQHQHDVQVEQQDSKQFSTQELEQLMRDLNFDPNLDQTESSINLKYNTVSMVDLQRVAQSSTRLNPTTEVNSSTQNPAPLSPVSTDTTRPQNQPSSPVPPLTPAQREQLLSRQSLEVLQQDALVTSLIVPSLNTMFYPEHKAVDLNFKLQPSSNSFQIPHGFVPQQLQHLAQCVEIPTEVLSLSLLPHRFTPSFNVDAIPDAFQRAMPLSLLIKQKQNILKYNAQFDANIKPDGFISLALADQVVSSPNTPTSPHYDQLTTSRAHFPHSFSRPKSIYDLNALIYHHLSNFFFMQSFTSCTLEELVKSSTPEFWVPYPQNPSCQNCQTLYSRYTDSFTVPIDHNFTKTLQEEYQYFLPCLCRMKSQNEKYLSQYLEVGDPELPMPPPPNSHRWKSYLYGDPAILSWPSIVPFSLLISLAFTYYQQQVLFTLISGVNVGSANQPLRCPLDQYDLTAFPSLPQSQQQTILATNSFKWLLQSLTHPIAYSTALVELDPEIVAAFFPNQLPPLVYLIPDRTDHLTSTQPPEDVMNGLPVDPTASFTHKLVADHIEDTDSRVVDDIFVINTPRANSNNDDLKTRPSRNMNDENESTSSTTTTTIYSSFDMTSITDPYGTNGLLFPFALSPDNIAIFRSCAYHIDILPPSHRFRLFRHANCLFPLSETTYLVQNGHILTASELRTASQTPEQSNQPPPTSLPNPQPRSAQSPPSPAELSCGDEDDKKKKSTRGRKSLQWHLEHGGEPQWARSKLRKLKRERNNHDTAEQLAAIWDQQDATVYTHNTPDSSLPQYSTLSENLEPVSQQNFNSTPNHLALVQLGNCCEATAGPTTEPLFNPTSTVQSPQLYPTSFAPHLSTNPVYTNPPTITSCTTDVHTVTTSTTYQQQPLPRFNSNFCASDCEDDFDGELLLQPIGLFSSLYPDPTHLLSPPLEPLSSQNQSYSPLPLGFKDQLHHNHRPISPLTFPTSSPSDQFPRQFTLSFLAATLPNNLDCYTFDSKLDSD